MGAPHTERWTRSARGKHYWPIGSVMAMFCAKLRRSKTDGPTLPDPHKPLRGFSLYLRSDQNLLVRFSKKPKNSGPFPCVTAKNPENYLTAVKLASACTWIRANEALT